MYACYRCSRLQLTSSCLDSCCRTLAVQMCICYSPPDAPFSLYYGNNHAILPLWGSTPPKCYYRYGVPPMPRHVYDHHLGTFKHSRPPTVYPSHTHSYPVSSCLPISYPPITMSEDHFVFTAKYQSRVKALTVVATVAALFGCLTADWENVFGPNHVFSGVKPAIKGFFNDLYGIAPAQASGSGDARPSSSSKP